MTGQFHTPLNGCETSDIVSAGKNWKLDLGASPVGKYEVSFRVWASNVNSVSVRIVPDGHTIEARLEGEGNGYFSGKVEGAGAGARYFYVLDGKASYPDPVSRSQPEGVHGPSEVIDPEDFPWTDDEWKSPELEDFIIYELHVGTFSEEGTFEAVIPRLDYLIGLGITAIELMPVAQFSGARNWGYDGVYPFAPQNSYGGPNGLKKLINAAHEKGLSVILDVVYNHLGPEGNYLRNYAPYFTGRYKTPWGDAVNFDGPMNEGVRHYFAGNALHWINEYHIDALRLDAVHSIFDAGVRHFLEELRACVRAQAQETGRRVYLIAESDLNEPRLVESVHSGGYGLDAQWNEDFHHALHAVITGEDKGYYKDFGKMEHLTKAFAEGFVYTGQYSAYRKGNHGKNSRHVPANKFIVFTQSHDQVGNRPLGDRPGLVLPFEKLKLAAGTVLLSPYIPLLFMGEEYGETAPFQYFTDHTDEALASAVRKGRSEEMSVFGWETAIPDPQAESTFLNSRISVDLHLQGRHKVLFDLYRELIRFRKDIPALRKLSRDLLETGRIGEEKALFFRRWFEDDEVFCLYNYEDCILETDLTLPAGDWNKLLESSSGLWEGTGELAEDRIVYEGRKPTVRLKPHSFVLYRKAARSV